MSFLTNSKEKKLWLWTISLILLLCGLLILIKYCYGLALSQQQLINKHLTDNIRLVDQDIKEIASLQKKRQMLLDYWAVTSELTQFNRYQVKNLSNLVNSLPKRLKLEEFSKQKHIYTLQVEYSTAVDLELGALELRKLEDINTVSVISLQKPANGKKSRATIAVEFKTFSQGDR